MTLSSRNSFFKAGIVVCLAALAVTVYFSSKILPVYPELAARAARRAPGLVQGLIGRFLSPAPYAAFAVMIVSIVYALITLVLIYYFFEKTHAPEILFFALFALSLAFEGTRIVLPLRRTFELPSVYLVMAARALFFARYFGIFSLFAGSLYAAGLETQKLGNIVLAAAAAALVFALGIPVDGLSWDSSLNVITGYPLMFTLVELGLVLITAASFLVAAYCRGSKEYLLMSLGSLLVYLGRNMLFHSDTWITLFPALVLLVLGAWFVCAQIHRVYLWL